MPTPDQGALLPLPKTLTAKPICVSLEIPGDQESISNFVGVLYKLALWNTYQRDDAKTARKVAQQWKNIISQALFYDCDSPPGGGDGCGEGCDMCCLRVNSDGILQELKCGVWTDVEGAAAFAAKVGGIAQPAPVGAIALGECYEADVTLSGSNVYNLPVPVGPGYVVTVTDAVGGWSDGDAVGILPVQWSCPSGTVYALGACGAPNGPDGGDPAPALDHMRLILNYAGGYSDAYNTSFTVPFGGTATAISFQANDAAIANNFGSITFHVKVCNQAPVTYDRIVDFRTSTSGFVNYPANEGPGCSPTLTPYTPGTGWEVYRCPSIGASYIEIINNPFTATEIDDLTLTFTTDDTGLTASDAEIFLELAGGEVLVASLATPWLASNVLHVAGSWLATGIRIRIGIASLTANVLITELELKGPGIAPF